MADQFASGFGHLGMTSTISLSLRVGHEINWSKTRHPADWWDEIFWRRRAPDPLAGDCADRNFACLSMEGTMKRWAFAAAVGLGVLAGSLVAQAAPICTDWSQQPNMRRG